MSLQRSRTLKLLATYGLLRHVREARVAGYDDALFVDRAGMLSEGSTWNLCMYDGEQWLWPDANVLTGITMLLLRRAMQGRRHLRVSPDSRKRFDRVHCRLRGKLCLGGPSAGSHRRSNLPFP